jgi:hypothetical protein
MEIPLSKFSFFREEFNIQIISKECCVDETGLN